MKKSLIVAICVLLVGACATVKPMSESEVIGKYDYISNLDGRLTSANGNDIQVLAPAGYGQAKELLSEAVENAREGNEGQAKEAAIKGLNVLGNAEKDSEQTREVMWEVLEYRARARKTGAPTIYGEEFENTEKRFREANRLIERKEIENAKNRRPELIKAYNNLEVKTLKEGAVGLAKASVEQAATQDADEHAPKTFNRAKKELNQAVVTLEVDPSQIDKANAYARSANDLAGEAEQITELAKVFDRRDYSYEDILLWYQQQLTEINTPLGTKLDFTQPNRKVVGSIRDSIASVLQSQKDDLALIEKQQKYIEEVKAELVTQANQYQKKDTLEAQARQRFDYVQSLFSPEEAEVFRKGNNVLISVTGFYFPVGGTDILPQNFGLMNKIINSIRQFADSRVRISGHTDSIGTTELNQRLSQERADNVAKFLIEVGNIPADRVEAEGFGESKPVASNETEEGRTKNRRIEVLIINK